jgi:hypothetical protein
MEEQKNKKIIQIPGWTASLALCIVFVIFLVILYLTFIRFKLVSGAIDNNSPMTSAILLSPELAYGLATFI